MKQRKMTKKQHSENISIITFGMIILAVGFILAALIISVGNRKSYLIALLNKSNETNNSIDFNKDADSVDLKIASTVATTSGRVALNVITDSINPDTFKEYRYYIKESKNDIYVLDAIKVEEQHAYVKLDPNTSYDVKVEAVSYSGETMVSTTSGETPTID